MLASKTSLIGFLEKHAVDSDVSEFIKNSLSMAKEGQITIHPYGFYIIKPNDTHIKQVRIHIWLDNIRHGQKPDWPPHNHNFNLDSIVINGRLTHNIWSISPNMNSLNILYEVSYESGISKLIKTTNPADCTKLISNTYVAGDSYHLGKYAFHSVDVEKHTETSTLCVMTNPGSDPQYVVGTVSGDASYEFSREKVTSKEQQSIIQVLEKIQSELIV